MEFNSPRAYVRLDELKTAQQIHKEEMRVWSYRWRYHLGWPGNQTVILWLKWVTRESRRVA
jgi:hypothetical protein